MDIGPGASHNILAVELMLQRKNKHEIVRLIYHSLKTIERYTISFAGQQESFLNVKGKWL